MFLGGITRRQPVAGAWPQKRAIAMNELAKRIQKPRCFLVYAFAPDDLPAAGANRIFNSFIADPTLPPAIFHDHFIGEPGGSAIFYVDNLAARDALVDQEHLKGWHVQVQPLIFSHSPSAFDEQTAFTLKAYRGMDWEKLRREQRPLTETPPARRKPVKRNKRRGQVGLANRPTRIRRGIKGIARKNQSPSTETQSLRRNPALFTLWSPCLRGENALPAGWTNPPLPVILCSFGC
jgi:hypothetical protein